MARNLKDVVRCADLSKFEVGCAYSLCEIKALVGLNEDARLKSTARLFKELLLVGFKFEIMQNEKKLLYKLIETMVEIKECDITAADLPCARKSVKSVVRDADIDVFVIGVEYTEKGIRTALEFEEKSTVKLANILNELLKRGLRFETCKEGRATKFKLVSANATVDFTDIGNGNKSIEVCLAMNLLYDMAQKYGNCFTVDKNFLLNYIDNVYSDLICAVNDELEYFNSKKSQLKIAHDKNSSDIQSVCNIVKQVSFNTTLYKELNELLEKFKCDKNELSEQMNELDVLQSPSYASVNKFKKDVLFVSRDKTRRSGLDALAKSGVITTEFSAVGEPVFERQFVFYTADNEAIDNGKEYDIIMKLFGNKLNENEHMQKYFNGVEEIIKDINNHAEIKNKYKTYSVRLKIHLNPNITFTPIDDTDLTMLKYRLHQSIIASLERKNDGSDEYCKYLNFYKSLVKNNCLELFSQKI